MRGAALTLVLFGALGIVAGFAFAQDEAKAMEMPPGVEATVDDLAFVSGDWELKQGDDLLEEHWTEPSGDCLMGSFRWLKKGNTVWMYEFLTMRNEEGGVTMRFRHFDHALTCWEEKTAPLVFRLVELDSKRAVFEHLGDNDPWTMTFHRVDEDGLTITLRDADEPDGPGKPFAYRRPVPR